MTISVFDLFTIGVGPSSSHTVGPMNAAAAFVAHAAERGLLAETAAVGVDLYGSLASTGRGHGTMDAILLGLEGCASSVVLPAEMETRLRRIAETGSVELARTTSVPFGSESIVLHPLTFLERHSNGMTFELRDGAGSSILRQTFFSIGGGAIELEGAEPPSVGDGPDAPMPFGTAAELLAHCDANDLPFSGVMLANELAVRSSADIDARLTAISTAMDACAASGIARTGVLPGGLDVPRRAPAWRERLAREDPGCTTPFWQEWVNLVALAVNEENASGGRVVTAPTNGAAGIVPAVLFYALHFAPGAGDATPAEKQALTKRFLLAAGAVGVLYKTRASISGAEVGCQGEVGSASSMAAAGLAEVLGGTPRQVENAAEIAMEHNLGLTCDPVGGLVQIPCIERNAIGAAKAVNAARMALWGDGSHRVSLDAVIDTMRETGRDMSSKYKETSMGGLAVNVVDC